MASIPDVPEDHARPCALSAQLVTKALGTSFIRLLSRVINSHMSDQQQIEIIESAAETVQAQCSDIFSREVTHAVMIVRPRHLQDCG